MPTDHIPPAEAQAAAELPDLAATPADGLDVLAAAGP